MVRTLHTPHHLLDLLCTGFKFSGEVQYVSPVLNDQARWCPTYWCIHCMIMVIQSFDVSRETNFALAT